MIAAAGIAERKGLIKAQERERQNRLLERVGINRELNGISHDGILHAMSMDKKVYRGKIRFVLPDSIGSVKVYDDVTEDEIKAGIEYMFDYTAG